MFPKFVDGSPDDTTRIDPIFQQSADLLNCFASHTMTKVSFNSMLGVVNKYSPQIPKNLNSLIKFLEPRFSFLEYKIFFDCENCLKSFYIEKSTNYHKCPECFKPVSVFYHINILNQLKDIIKRNICNFNLHSDSKIYKIVKQEYQKFLSLTINTDGAQIFESSDRSFHPIYLVVNELELKKRFELHNIIIAGVWIGPKPNYIHYLKPIITELLSLEKGEILSLNQHLEELIHVFLIFGVFDKPARAAMLNMMQYNGKFGCLKCYHPGESQKTDKGGTFRTYPNENYPLRNHKEYHKDLNKLKNDQTKAIDNYNGVKGHSELNELAFYFVIESTAIDYMHSVLEGVVRRLIEYWFSSKYSREKFSLRYRIEEIDSNLVQIRVPKFIPRPPRSLNLVSMWKANELLSFLIYYSLPLFNGIMKPIYFEHLVNLVVSIEHLLNKNFSNIYLDQINELLKEYVSNMETLYGSDKLLSGVHELLHIVDDVKNIGPLNEFNCFQFENLNRIFGNFIHGNHVVGVELFNTLDALKCSKLVNQKSETYQPKLILHRMHSITITPNQSELKKIRDANLCIDEFELYSSIEFNGQTFTSFEYQKTQNLDLCVKYGDKIGLIKYFLCKKDKCFIICSLLSNNDTLFLNSKFPHLKSSTLFCNKSKDESIFLCEISEVKKCLYLNINKQIYVSFFQMSHLFN